MIAGTRESELAMRQAEIFASALRRAHPGIEVEIKGMRSSGDIDLKSPLSELQGFGAFVRELDAAVLAGEADFSVNSMKDMPVDVREGLRVAAVLSRAAAEDVILPCPLESLAEGAVVGTSSIRRAAELKAVRPDLAVKPVRGNVRTRMARLDSGEFDAIVLAKAGLDRLSERREAHVLDPAVFVPAPAQGAIAAVCRADDAETIRLLAAVDDPAARTETGIERALMKMLGAGCSSPVGIHASLEGKRARVRAVSFEFTEEPVRVDARVDAEDPGPELEKIAALLRGGARWPGACTSSAPGPATRASSRSRGWRFSGGRTWSSTTPSRTRRS